MGIYIKGMDFLPEDGTEFVVKKDEYGTWIKPIGHMGFSMRLIELPEDHGDLIDRDALGITEHDGIFEICNKIKCASVIIEAEGSENHDD